MIDVLMSVRGLKRSSLIALALSCGLASTPLTAGDVTKGLIRGSIGVAGVELGMSRSDVIRVLGQPESENKTSDGHVIYMSYHSSENFGVYFDHGSDSVSMLIVAVQSRKICTAYGACLYREGDLGKIKKHYGKKLVRFVDRDGSVTYRRLAPLKPRKVMTEFTPNEERKGVMQVMIKYWDGKITDSSFD